MTVDNSSATAKQGTVSPYNLVVKGSSSILRHHIVANGLLLKLVRGYQMNSIVAIQLPILGKKLGLYGRLHNILQAKFI